MSSSEEIDLTRAALRAQGSSRFIASLLPGWERAFGESADDFLGADKTGLATLALCTRPAQNRWERDVVSLAAVCGIDEARLSAFLRQAMTVESLATAPAVEDVVDGRLLAARDREEQE